MPFELLPVLLAAAAGPVFAVLCAACITSAVLAVLLLLLPLEAAMAFK